MYDQTMLEQQLLQQERLQTQNERLAKQVSLISSDEQSAVAGCNSGNYVGNSLLTETEKAADTVVISHFGCFRCHYMNSDVNGIYMMSLWQ